MRGLSWRLTLAIALVYVAVVGLGPALAKPVVERKTLDNGLEIIVVENRLTPLVSVELAVRHGVMTEGPRETGLAHLFEHLLFRPNQVLATDDALTARKLELGVGIFGGTDEEAVRFGLTGHSASLTGALDLLRDMVVYPRFDETTLVTEKKVIATEDRHRSGPANVRAVKVEELLWWKYPTRKWEIGEAKNLPAITLADLRRVKQRFYVPNNAALVVVGNVDARQVFAAAGQSFAGWKREKIAPRAAVVHPPLASNRVLVDPMESPLVSGSFFWHGPSAPGPDAPMARAARLLEAAFRLASPARTRLEQRCRSFALAWHPSSNVGELELRWESEPGRADACIAGVIDELATTATNFAEAELARAREVAVGDILRAREETEALARDVGQAWAAGDPLEALDLVERLDKVGHPEIVRLVDRFVVGRPFVLAVMLPQDQIDKGMNQAHFKTLVGQRRPLRAHP